MKKNHDTSHVQMDIDMFMAVYRSGNIDPKTMKHIRKFNPHLQLYFNAERKQVADAYRLKRQRVLNLQDRYGKIVFLVDSNIDSTDFEPMTTYTPMQLIGKDHGNKLRLRLKGLMYSGMKPGTQRQVKSYSIEKISRTMPEDYVYWRSGPYINKFTETHQSRHEYITLDQYLAQWNEALR